MKDGGLISQVFVAILQRLLHLSFIIANVKEDGFDSLNIASKVSLRKNQATALCDEAGEGGEAG